MTSDKTKLLFTAFVLISAALAWLFINALLHGGTQVDMDLAGSLGKLWCIMAAFLVVPVWRVVRRWTAPHQMTLVGGVLIGVGIVGCLCWIRVKQVERLEGLIREARDVAMAGAPKKRLFIALTRDEPQSLPEYERRCTELGPVVADYMSAEQQMDKVIAQMQLEIFGLKPQGSFANFLPVLKVMRSLTEKDLEAGRVYKEELDYASQLKDIPAARRADFYSEKIRPVTERERKIAQDEIAIVKDAEARGVALPKGLFADSGD